MIGCLEGVFAMGPVTGGINQCLFTPCQIHYKQHSVHQTHPRTRQIYVLISRVTDPQVSFLQHWVGRKDQLKLSGP